MTPNEIEVLLHCHTSPKVHDRADAPAVNSAIQMFLGCNIIVKYGGEDYYVTTERGNALVKLLCSVQFPEQVWVDSSGNVIELD